MHWVCFVWTLTRPPFCWRTPRPGVVRVCVCPLPFARLGGPAFRARFGAPNLSFGRFVLLLCSARSALGLPLSCLFVCLLSFLCCLFLPRSPPPVSLAFWGFQPRLSWALELSGAPPTLSFFFFLLPPCLCFFVVSGPRCFGPWRFLAACPPLLLRPLVFFSPLFGGPRLFVHLALELPGWISFSSLACGLACGACVVPWCCAPPPRRLLLVFCGFPRLVVWCRGLVWLVFRRFSVPGCGVVRVPFCLVCCCVVLLALSPAVCRWRSLRRSSFVPCVVVRCCVLWCFSLCYLVSWCIMSSGRLVRCVAFCCVGCVGFYRSVASSCAAVRIVAWSRVVACCCALSWGAALCYFGVPPVVLVLLFVSCPSVWCSVASFALAGTVFCCPLFLGVRRWVWLSAVVFGWHAWSLVFLSGRLACCPIACCGLSWCPAPLWVVSRCRAVVSCCLFCFAGADSLFPFPLCGWGAVLVRLRRAVRCRFGLCWFWCLLLWFVAVRCAVSFGVLWCCGAALLFGVVCRGVLLYRTVSCAAVLLGCAVCFPLLRFVVALFSTAKLLKIFFYF